MSAIAQLLIYLIKHTSEHIVLVILSSIQRACQLGHVLLLFFDIRLCYQTYRCEHVNKHIVLFVVETCRQTSCLHLSMSTDMILLFYEHVNQTYRARSILINISCSWSVTSTTFIEVIWVSLKTLRQQIIVTTLQYWNIYNRLSFQCSSSS